MNEKKEENGKEGNNKKVKKPFIKKSTLIFSAKLIGILFLILFSGYTGARLNKLYNPTPICEECPAPIICPEPVTCPEAICPEPPPAWYTRAWNKVFTPDEADANISDTSLTSEIDEILPEKNAITSQDIKPEVATSHDTKAEVECPPCNKPLWEIVWERIGPPKNPPVIKRQTKIAPLINLDPSS